MNDRIPQSTIDDLLNRTDLVELVGSYIKLKKAGKNYVACCPFHKERSPSFSVSPDKQLFYCFGCGAGGNAIGFVMDYESIGFPQAVRKILGRDFDATNATVTARRQRESFPDCHRSNPEKAREDLARAITSESHPLFAQEHTWSPSNCLTIGNTLALPIINGAGELVNVAAIAPNYKIFWSAGAPSFGAFAVIPARQSAIRRILCIDYFDGWRLWWKLRGDCEVRCTISPDVFIHATRKMRDMFDAVAVDEEDAEEYREMGLEVVVLPAV